jgi:hypothetical protein
MWVAPGGIRDAVTSERISGTMPRSPTGASRAGGSMAAKSFAYSTPPAPQPSWSVEVTPAGDRIVIIRDHHHVPCIMQAADIRRG